MSRARVWTFITYPDSLPSNLQAIIEGDTEPIHEIANVPLVISPIHDKDVADEGKGYNGTIYKKPHYHNMVLFSQVKSYKQVVAMVKPLGASHVSQVHSTQSMVRYFIHADHKQKAQYKKQEIRAFNGVDVDHIFEHNDREVMGMVKELIELIDDNDIVEYHVLVKLCLRPEFYERYFPLVTGKYQFFVLNFIKSKMYEAKGKAQQ